MSLRFYPILLSVVMLMILGACGTTGSAPVVESTDPSLTAQVSDREFPDTPDPLPLDPSERSLEQTFELSKTMSGYQPDLALEILRSLESASSSQLAAMIDGQTQDPEFEEWLELSLMIRSLMLSGDPVTPAAQHWANYHYGHAVNRDNFPGLVSDYRALFPAPSWIAICRGSTRST